MFDYIKEYMDLKSITDYQKSEIILNIFFSLVDIIFIILSILKFSSKNRIILSLRFKLISIFIIDIIIKLLTAFFFPKDNIKIFTKEIITSLMNSCLFFVILSLFSQVIHYSNIKDNINIIIPLLLFILIAFPHEKIITKGNPLIINTYSIPFSNIVLLLKYIFSIGFIILLYYIIKKRIILIVSKLIEKENIKELKFIYKIILGSSFAGLLLYLSNYLINIIFLFIKDPLIIFYGNIAVNIFKEGGKYYAFIICGIFVYVINKFNSELELYSKTTDEVEIINN